MKVAVVRTGEGWVVEVNGSPVTTHATEAEARATCERLSGRAPTLASDPETDEAGD
jgi:hypothetical protein